MRLPHVIREYKGLHTYSQLQEGSPTGKLRDLEHVTSIIATHQIRDAFYIATHTARRADGRIEIDETSGRDTASAIFMVLHMGRLHFQGTAAELLGSPDPYLKEFLFMTLPPW